MTSEEAKKSLLISIPIYCVILIICGYIGFRRRTSNSSAQQQTTQNKGIEEGENDKAISSINCTNDAGCNESSLEAHYLAGRSFGPIMTAGSMYASIFSGYTLVGVPNEAFGQTGFLATRWILAVIMLVAGMFTTGARLRKIGILRNHQSPIDFITDRFQSQVLRYTIMVLMFLPALCLLTGQLVAIRTTFNSLFDIPQESPVATLVISALLLLLEWAGGLNTVALTDCIQVGIMVFCFIALPLVVSRNFVGWNDLDYQTYPRPDFYQTPQTAEAWQFWNFAMIFFSGFTMPMMMQRVYAAESFKASKVGYSAVLAGNWLNMISGIFIGTVGVQMLADLGMVEDEDDNTSTVTTTSSPFGKVLEAVIELGGFPHVVGIVASTAALAAIMSTADSILISISHLLTSEVIEPLCPNARGKRLTSLGRLCSFISMVSALFFSFYAGQNISQLASIQYSIQMQMLPSFLLGLFVTSSRWDCHPWSLATSAIIGTVTTIVIAFAAPAGHWMNFGTCGFLFNAASLFFIEKCRRVLLNTNNFSKSHDVESDNMVSLNWDMPSTDRFCCDHAHSRLRPLSAELITDAMSDISEAIVEPWFVLLLLGTSILSSPFTESGTPPLGEDDTLLWEPNLVGGIPAWTFRILVVGMVPMTLVAARALNFLPDSLFEDETSNFFENGDTKRGPSVRLDAFGNIIKQ